MTTLVNRKFEMIAIPPKTFQGEDLANWAPILEMSGHLTMDHAPHSALAIEQREGGYLKKLVPNIDVMSDLATVLVFQINLDRKLIATYLHRAHCEIKNGLKERGPSSPEDLKSVIRGSKAVVFNGELVRDFHRKAYSILVACHLADPIGFSTNRVVSITSSGATSERFKMHLMRPRDRLVEVPLRKLPHRALLDFLWARPTEIAGQPKSQFMKGLSYVSQTFRNLDNPLVVFMWSLASLEAMLSTTSDKANSSALELRLRALLDTENAEHIVGRFRELYKYRNAVFHGNVALPFTFDERNLFGFSGIKHSNTAPYEIASFTYALALKVLQRFFELGRYDVKYDVIIHTNGKPEY